MGSLSQYIPKGSETVDLIYAYHKARGDAEPQRGYLGASSIGTECERALWYSFRGLTPPSFDGRLYRLFETGDLEEFRFVKELKEIGVEVHEVGPDGKQFEINALGGHFSGHMDGAALHVPVSKGLRSTKWHVLEFKTCNAKTFAKLEKDGVQATFVKHYAQMQTYMGGTGMRRALYLARNKNTDHLYSERVKFDAEFHRVVLEKAERIISTSRPPERVTDRQDSWACKFCDAYTLCWGVDRAGVEPEVAVPIPSKTCRSCCHATANTNADFATWDCEKFNTYMLDTANGGECKAHLLLPGLVAFAEPTDADKSSITFRSNDGTEWKHGNGHVTTEELLSGPRPCAKPLPLALVEDEPLTLLARYDWGGSELAWEGHADGLDVALAKVGYTAAQINAMEPRRLQSDLVVNAAEYRLNGETYLIVLYKKDDRAQIWKGRE